MSLLFRIVCATACRSTHHQLVMDALRRLRGPDADRWRDLFLKHHASYLAGAKAPDTQFKDFKNHVLHVAENYWGGAVAAAQSWYGRTVDGLRQQAWGDAAFAAGVLSHYYTDPLMPFHTGQSEEEGAVHRAAEWSVACAFDELRAGFAPEPGPEVAVPSGPDWLAAMVREGATLAHPHYEVLIDHYDLARGVKDPPAGLDAECRRRLAQCLDHAASGFARILEKALAEAGVAPPSVTLSLEAFLAALTLPVRWVTRKLADARERAVVEKIYAEVRQHGKVIANLPEDERTVRGLHAAEVLKVSLQELDARVPRPMGRRHGQAAAPPPTAVRSLRFYLHPDSPVVDAPAIGPNTAKRFAAIGVRTVADLLALDPAAVAERLDVRALKAKEVRAMQAQAALVCRIPRLRGHDAQLLVACGITEPADLAGLEPAALLERLQPFLTTSAARRILRDSSPPDLAEVTDWIAQARQARPLRVA